MGRPDPGLRVEQLLSGPCARECLDQRSVGWGFELGANSLPSGATMRLRPPSRVVGQFEFLGVSAVRASLWYQPGGFAVGSASMASTNVDAQAVATSVRYFSLTLSTQPASMTKLSRW